MMKMKWIEKVKRRGERKMTSVRRYYVGWEKLNMLLFFSAFLIRSIQFNYIEYKTAFEFVLVQVYGTPFLIYDE